MYVDGGGGGRLGRSLLCVCIVKSCREFSRGNKEFRERFCEL